MKNGRWRLVVHPVFVNSVDEYRVEWTMLAAVESTMLWSPVPSGGLKRGKGSLHTALAGLHEAAAARFSEDLPVGVGDGPIDDGGMNVALGRTPVVETVNLMRF